jgi:hypothetical protein
MRRCLGPGYGEQQGPQNAVLAAQLLGLARQSFPLCMQHMYRRAHTDSHLKHCGRLQLGLFLKARAYLLCPFAMSPNAAHWIPTQNCWRHSAHIKLHATED